MIAAIELQEILYTAAVGLLGGLLWLYRQLGAKTDEAIRLNQELTRKAEDRWEACEAKHEESQGRVIELSEKVGELTGKVQAYGEVITATQTLAEISTKAIDRLNGPSSDHNLNGPNANPTISVSPRTEDMGSRSISPRAAT